MAKIVISYRRADSSAMAGRIRDCLVDHFGKSAVYMDIEDIPAGYDFRRHITSAIEDAGLALAIVGPHWLGRRRGGTRIVEAEDPIRTEIEAILARDIPLIPVLVDDAEVPKPADLPESIRDFVFRHALSVDSGQDFHFHMERLIRHVEGIVGETAPPLAGVRADVRGWTEPGRRHWLAGLVAGACLVLAGMSFVYLARDRPSPIAMSYWEVNGSIVNREASGSQRRLVFVRPSAAQLAGGAMPGSLFFEGRLVAFPETETKRGYAGKVVLYLGACGARAFEAGGPELPGPEIVLTGQAPRLDAASCKTIEAEEMSLVVSYRGTTLPPEGQ